MTQDAVQNLMKSSRTDTSAITGLCPEKLASLRDTRTDLANTSDGASLSAGELTWLGQDDAGDVITHIGWLWSTPNALARCPLVILHHGMLLWPNKSRECCDVIKQYH